MGYINSSVEPGNPYQASEVSEMLWLTYEDVINKIRPYNLEKLEILKKVNTVLNRYRICC